MSAETANPMQQLALLADAEVLTPTGLRLPDDFPYEHWETLGVYLSRLRDLTAFLVGDWLLFGEDNYDEHLVQQAQEMTGRSKATLLKYRWVCQQVPHRYRRPALSFSHHELVASLPRAEQQSWLERAEGLSVEEFRGLVREPSVSTPKVTVAAGSELRVATEEGTVSLHVTEVSNGVVSVQSRPRALIDAAHSTLTLWGAASVLLAAGKQTAEGVLVPLQAWRQLETALDGIRP